MKQTILWIVTLLTGIAHAQADIEGSWKGYLEVAPGQGIPVLYHIKSHAGGAFTATHDSPDQYSCGTPVSEITYQKNRITLKIAKYRSSYSGKINADGTQIIGKFKQNGQSLKLKLDKQASSPAVEEFDPNSIAGDWFGYAEIPGQQLPVVFHIKTDQQGLLSSTQDSPSQFICGYPVSTTRFENGELQLSIARFNFTYSGQVANDFSSIDGYMTQNGSRFPLKLNRKMPDTKPQSYRPQHPKGPFPYQSEAVVFFNHSDQVELSGTLTLPKGKGPFPAAILVSGSGPQDRDETMLGHKPFLVIADHLSRHGVAVLRYDDRGVGSSQGNHATATSENFSKDTEAAFDYLLKRTEINARKIGIIGHSEGGIIGPMVAQRRADLGFMILMAAPADDGLALMLQQQKDLAPVEKMSQSLVTFNRDVTLSLHQVINEHAEPEARKTAFRQSLQDYLNNADASITEIIGEPEPFISSQLNLVESPWYAFFLNYDPADSLRQISCPTLALNGDLDLQVNADINLGIIKQTNPSIQTRKLKNLNHLFQTTQTGALREYAQIEQTISPEVLEILSDWINNQNRD